MHAVVLGAAAGGGVPQWNCGCPVCRLAWAGDSRVRPRTQSSIAVSANGADWLLLNASPDIRQQILAVPALQPREFPRHSPIAAVLLTNGDVDHVAGLLGLRERQAFTLYGTAETLDSLAGNRVFDVLARDVVRRRAVLPGQSFEAVPGLTVTLVPVPGKLPLWREDEPMRLGEESEATVGAILAGGSRRIAYIPGCAAVPPWLRETIADADLLLFDGTLWEDDEMIRHGVGTKTGRRMGHMPIAGPEGSMAALSGLPVRQRVFIHLNNTNPVLVEGSPERRAVETAGWQVAHDGMVFHL
ncbi:pyrroloquinoline quinone biosynthesis protein PqqB [Labrys sp. KNU-23]|uniref:pyrroloquinoline quinone biosynthesis protein PqqB n=1 Tax=Labrys sp. KNU-23 TaxID=2789216 RepID=UPI0011EED166|nr:pyrroloquinoline quinone biosynthesis protein PqqB [Labrys sp. KNU-23]QEN86561.1 pyrroloquinoline quinone biosynthesis protein PqqB [Labrys sp. KNU-23]